MLASGVAPLRGSSGVPRVCETYYFVSALIVEEPSRAVLQLDEPINVSLGNIDQRSELLVLENVSPNLIVNASDRGFHGALFIVKLCYPRPSWMVKLLLLLMLDPYAFRNYSVPAKVLKEYVGKPEPVILNVAKSFVSWLRSNGVDLPRLSVAGLAVEAALFVYFVYIKYSPSPMPRSVEETVKLRKGDCDDMSRVLTELLWHFYIPAAMLYGFVEVNFSRAFTVKVGSFEFESPNLAPHAFVVSYLPPFGWLSIDLLAGSYITNPFIATGLTTNTRVNETKAKELIETLESMKSIYLALAIPKKLLDEASMNLGVEPGYLALALSKHVAELINAVNTSWRDVVDLLRYLSHSENVYQKALRIIVALWVPRNGIVGVHVVDHVLLPR